MTTDKILETILALVSILITGFLLPLLTKKFGLAKVNQASDQFDAWVTLADKVVAAAKQKVDLVSNADMKAYAEATLKSLGVPESVLEVVIEAAVKGLKIAESTVDVAKQIDATVKDAIVIPAPVPAPVDAAPAPESIPSAPDVAVSAPAPIATPDPVPAAPALIHVLISPENAAPYYAQMPADSLPIPEAPSVR